MTYDKSTIVFAPLSTHPRFVDLTDRVFTRLTILGYAGSNKHGQAQWWCECECGNISRTTTAMLTTEHTRSCGCWGRDNTSLINRTHGMRHTPEYRSFVHAKDRCNNPNDKSYSDYGGRGIEFRFNSFEEFFTYMGKRPSLKYSLDRINNDGHYEKGNVKWATPIEQGSHKRDTRWFTFAGRTQTLAQWSRELNMGHTTILARLRRGWTLAETFTIPLGTVKNILLTQPRL